jgi:hypothetical protein
MADNIDQHQDSSPNFQSKSISKNSFDHVELVENGSVHHSVPEKQSRAPELIRNMTPELRAKLESSLRRKIDLRLLPMIVIMYILNYLDRNNIAAARLAGLEKDLKMHGNQFQVRAYLIPSSPLIQTFIDRQLDFSEHFVRRLLVDAGYAPNQSWFLFDTHHLHFAVPSNMLLNKLGKPSLYLPSCMVVWGIISGATAASQTYGGLLACRFILGFVEAAYFVSPFHSPSISLQDDNETDLG